MADLVLWKRTDPDEAADALIGFTDALSKSLRGTPSAKRIASARALLPRLHALVKAQEPEVVEIRKGDEADPPLRAPERDPMEEAAQRHRAESHLTSPAIEARARLRAMTEEIRATRPGLNPALALRLAVSTPEGAALFQQMKDRNPALTERDVIDDDTNQPATPAEEEPTMKNNPVVNILKHATDPDALAPDVVHAQIEAVATEIRKREPTLTSQRAYVKALEQRPDLWQLHNACHDRNGRALTVRQVRDREESLAKRGGRTWGDLFMDCAEAIALRDGLPIGDAIVKASTEPRLAGVYDQYQRETRGAA